MKTNNFKRLMTISSLLISLGFSSFSFSNDWADDWLASAVASGPTTYNSGAGRGFVSAGNIQFRANSSISYPISMSAPRIKGGCGGIDMFLGGMSYMDVDMLVDKFEEMIQNGEVIAFQMAIKALSEKLGVTTESIQNVMDMLNGLQLDSCAMAKSAVTVLADNPTDIAGAAKEVWGEISQGQELSLSAVKNAWEKGKNDAATNGVASISTDIKKQIAACPTGIKDLLTTDGSIVDNLAQIYGMNPYADFIRGYIGDVITDHDASAGNIPMAKTISGCPQNNDRGIDDLVYGRAFEKRAPVGLNDPYAEPGAGCSQPPNAINLVDYSRTRLEQLSELLKDPNLSLSTNPTLENWANNAPMSVIAAMKLANDAGIENEVIAEMSETLAYAYAYRIFDDMYRNTLFMFSSMNDKLTSATADNLEEATNTVAGTPAPKCDLKAYVVTIKSMSKLKDRIGEIHGGIKESYIRQNEQFQAQISQINRVQSFESRKFSSAGVR